MIIKEQVVRLENEDCCEGCPFLDGDDYYGFKCRMGYKLEDYASAYSPLRADKCIEENGKEE